MGPVCINVKKKKKKKSRLCRRLVELFVRNSERRRSLHGREHTGTERRFAARG